MPSTVARGVWGQALPLPQLPAHWAGCRGPRSTCCGRGRAGVGALLCPLGVHALWGLRAAGRVRGVRVQGGGLGGGGAPYPPFVRPGGPVGGEVALPRSVPLPSLGRQQSGCHWRRAVHGGCGPPYHSGSCSPAFSGRDLCGVLARWCGLACSPRPPWEPAAGLGGGVALRLLSRAGGGPSPLPRGVGAGAPAACGPVGGWGGGVAPRPPCSPSGWRPAVLNPAPPRVVGALPSGVRVRSGSQCRPGGGGGEGRPVDRSPGGPCRPEPQPLPSLSGLWSREGHVGRGPHTVLVRALLRHAGVGSPRGRDPRGSRSSRTPPPPPRVAVPSGAGGGGASPRLRGGGGPLLWLPSWGGCGGGGGGAPPPPRPVGRRPAFRCPRLAPPGYTHAVGVAGRPRASGAVRSAADGSVRRGGGGGSGGGPLVPWRRLLTAGGGGRHGGPGLGGQPSAGGSHPSPAPLYLEPDPRAGPHWGPSSPRPWSRGAGRPGAAVRVSGQRLAGCGAAGSPPRSLSPPSLPREVARAPASRRTVGGAWVGGPSSPPHLLASAVWAVTCAAACVGAGALAAAGCAGGSATGRGRYSKPGGASCWRPHP